MSDGKKVDLGFIYKMLDTRKILYHFSFYFQSYTPSSFLTIYEICINSPFLLRILKIFFQFFSFLTIFGKNWGVQKFIKNRSFWKKCLKANFSLFLKRYKFSTIYFLIFIAKTTFLDFYFQNHLFFNDFFKNNVFFPPCFQKFWFLPHFFNIPFF